MRTLSLPISRVSIAFSFISVWNTQLPRVNDLHFRSGNFFLHRLQSDACALLKKIFKGGLVSRTGTINQSRVTMALLFKNFSCVSFINAERNLKRYSLYPAPLLRLSAHDVRNTFCRRALSKAGLFIPR